MEPRSLARGVSSLLGAYLLVRYLYLLRYHSGIENIPKVDFEYDPAKSTANARKHGLDFGRARLLWSDTKRIEFVARFADEPRLGLVADLEGKPWTAIFTTRKQRVRTISVRRARKNEEALYYDSEGI